MWPTAPNSYDPLITNVRWSEIDFFEIDAEYNLHTSNVHYQDKYMGKKWELRQSTGNDFTINFNDFHKFSGEWTPNYIRFYFDDKLIQTSYTEYANDLIPMNLIIGIATPAGNFGKDFVSNSLFPYWFEIDYVKVYKLRCDKNTVVNEISNYNTFNYAVKKSISLSGVSSLSSGKNVFLRATDFIELKAGFEVPLGAELYLDISPCE